LNSGSIAGQVENDFVGWAQPNAAALEQHVADIEPIFSKFDGDGLFLVPRLPADPLMTRAFCD